MFSHFFISILFPNLLISHVLSFWQMDYFKMYIFQITFIIQKCLLSAYCVLVLECTGVNKTVILENKPNKYYNNNEQNAMV